MNTINFDKNNFPITTDVLSFLQAQIKLIQRLTVIADGNYILSGCKETDTEVASGYVVVDGEIMYFEGGNISEGYVLVIETETTIDVEDASYTETEKELTIGTGTDKIEWSTFRNIGDILTTIESNNEKVADIEKRLAIVEESLSTNEDRLTTIEGFKLKVVNIGAWSMSDESSVQVKHGITDGLTNIQSVTAILLGDTDDQSSTRNHILGYNDNGNVCIEDDVIVLSRNSSSSWQGFTDDSQNRGRLLIEYTEE